MSSTVFSPAQTQWLKQNLKLAVIHGGDSSDPSGYLHENPSPRSNKTYKAVAEDIAQALEESGFSQVSILAEDIDLAQKLKLQKIDLALLNSGGLQGFDSMCHLPSLLEMLGVPYVGHSPMTAGILDNKHLFKHEISTAGIQTAPFVTLQPGVLTDNSSVAKELDNIEHAFGKGFIVKPVSGRASIHVYPVFQRSELDAVVEKIHLATNNTVMIEPYLGGREFVVAVAGQDIFRSGKMERLDQPFTFSITERDLADDELIFTSMDIKPITQDRLKAVKSGELRAKLADIGARIHRLLDLKTLVRVDLRMDDKGELYVLEANPKPDLKRPCQDKVSLVCHDLSSEGMSYTDLLQSLVFNRLSDLKQHRPITASHCFGCDFDQLEQVN